MEEKVIHELRIVETEDGFRIEQWNGEGWNYIGTTDPDQTQFIMQGLQPETNYTVRVAAFAGGFDDANSDEFTF